MRLKTPFTLSLALLLGATPGTSEAAPKKKKAPVVAPVEAPPVEEPLPEPLPPPAPPALSALPDKPWAGRTVVVVEPSAPADAAAATRLEASLREALAAQSEVSLLDPVERFPAPPPLPLTRGDTLFDEGKGLYDNLDPEGAAKKFTAAASYYERLPVDSKPERLARVYIFLGASRLLDGDAPRAQTFFTRALLAEPNVKPESELFGQDVDQAFATAKTALEAQPKGTLTVDSVPQGARVAVHGEELGTTPLRGMELPPGAHRVVFTLPGHLPFGVFQEVKSGEAAELRPTLGPVPALGEFRQLATKVPASPALDAAPAGPAPAEAVALGGKIGARYVVFTRLERTGTGPLSATLYAWDVQGKNRLRGVKWNPEAPAEQQRVVRQVKDFVTGKHSAFPISLPPEVVAVVKKPWFWAAVGGVAVATTAGIVLAQQGSRPLGPRLGNFGAGW